MSSVVFRTSEITDADYAEAIEYLQDARRQPGDHGGCTVCGGTDGHYANACRHNSLVMARRFVQHHEAEYWRCFHCGEVFSIDQEFAAREHFGSDSGKPPACLSTEAPARLDRIRETWAARNNPGSVAWEGLYHVDVKYLLDLADSLQVEP